MSIGLALFVLGIIYLLGRKETRGIVLAGLGLFLFGFLAFVVIGWHVEARDRRQAAERRQAYEREQQRERDEEQCERAIKQHDDGTLTIPPSCLQMK